MKTLSELFRGTTIVFLVSFLFLCSFLHSQTFQDGPDNEPDGDFPSKWKLISGTSEIRTFEGEKVIYLSNKGIITPLLNSRGYLTDNFTLKFDAFFSKLEKPIYYYQYYTIRFWDGNGNVIVPSDSGTGFYDPVNIYRNGVLVVGREGTTNKIGVQKYDQSLESTNALWRSVVVTYDKGSLKISIDRIPLIDISFNYEPKMISIGSSHPLSDSSLTTYIAQIKKVYISGIDPEVSDNTSDTDTNTPSNNTNTLTGDYAYTLPSEDGLPNQILQTDGNGTVSWVDLPTSTKTPSASDSNGNLAVDEGLGLIAIDEGNGIGWRLKGFNTNNFGNIGQHAVDLSRSDISSTEFGAIGKNAFSSGSHNSSSGASSISMGSNNLASGEGSLALGWENISSNISSIAMGRANNSINDYAFTSGFDNVSSGQGSISLGLHNRATADYSFAVGIRNKASGTTSVALGASTEASGDFSLVAGYQSIAIGKTSLAIGQESLASGDFSTAIGRLTKATGQKSTALGDNTEAGNYATSMGFSTKATGDYSTAFGRFTKAIGVRSTAMGDDTEAGNYATAMGYKTIASGDFATAMGNNNKASGKNSTALGNFTKALNSNTVAMGLGTLASNENSLVIGKYNDPGNQTNVLFQIGNGTGDGKPGDGTYRANAFTVFDNGHFRAWGYEELSDLRLKNNINTLAYGINTILKLNPVSYTYKNSSVKKLGLIAQEVEPIINELVRVGDDANKTLSIDYVGLIPILIKSIQEQQEIIENQNKKIDHLSSELSEKDQTLTDLIARVKQIETLLKQEKL